MADIRASYEKLIERILEGEGRASQVTRRRAFDHAELAEPLRALIDKIVRRATDVRDEDIAAVRASGTSEDEIFELVVCAAVGAARRQYEGALAALELATTGGV